MKRGGTGGAGGGRTKGEDQPVNVQRGGRGGRELQFFFGLKSFARSVGKVAPQRDSASLPRRLMSTAMGTLRDGTVPHGNGRQALGRQESVAPPFDRRQITRAPKTDAPHGLEDDVEVDGAVHGLVQFDVTEMSVAHAHAVLAGAASKPTIGATHA